MEPRFGCQAGDVVAVRERAGRELGFPQAIRVDQGSELVSRAVDFCSYPGGVTRDFSRPGKPPDNAFIERLNGTFRVECLNAHWFRASRTRARSARRAADTTTKLPAQRDRQQAAG
jgi:putative transposase